MELNAYLQFCLSAFQNNLVPFNSGLQTIAAAAIMSSAWLVRHRRLRVSIRLLKLRFKVRAMS